MMYDEADQFMEIEEDENMLEYDDEGRSNYDESVEMHSY